MELNFIIVLIAALVPMLLGGIWYNPKVFGTVWAKEAGVDININNPGGNMLKIFALSILLSFFLAFGLQFMVVHKFHVYSLLSGEMGFGVVGSDMDLFVNDFMSKYGDRFLTFKHGALHGFSGGLLIATPVLAVNALFERKSFKYIALNAGFWILSMTIMGGLICQFTK